MIEIWKDALGNDILPGDDILYLAMCGRSPMFKRGKVLNYTKEGVSYYGDTRLVVRGERNSKDSFLHYADRIVSVTAAKGRA